MSEARSAAGRKGAAVTKAKRAAAGKVAARPAPVPKECLCGCGNMTKGGDFLQGHDARYKSELVRLGMQEDPAAIKLLEERGWLKFLEKKREIDARPKPEPGERVAAPPPSTLEEDFARWQGFKDAGARLRAVGRYSRSSGKQLLMTRDNWRTILGATDEQLEHWTQEDLDA